MDELEKLNLEVVESYKDLGEDWNSNIPDEYFMHPQHVSLAEKSGLADLTYKYIRVKIGDQTIAYMYFQMLKLHGDHIQMEESLWQNLALGSINVLRPKLLVFGHLFRHDIYCYYFVNKSFNSYMEAKILYRCCEKMLNTCGTRAILLKDLPDSYNSYLLHHAEKCKAMKEDVSMKLHILDTWHNLEDYLTSLKHKYKQRAKKILAKREGLYTRRLDAAAIEQYSDALMQSYDELISKQSIRLGKINIEFLKNLESEYPDFYFYGIFEKDSDRCIGFYSYFEKSDCLDMFYIGLLTEENHKYSLYFNILYWGIEQAINSRFTLVNYGRTALDPKASLGCAPYYSQNFYRIKSQILNRITDKAQNKFMEKQGEVWESRKPFNSQYYESLKEYSSIA